MKTILFVDDEASLLQGLQRALRSERSRWNMLFAASGREALEMIAKQPIDAVVTDMRMPEMSGADLLERLVETHPEIIRIILSGHSDEELIVRSANTAHQYLSKPCDVDRLKETLNRAFELRGLLGEGPVQSFVTGVKNIPSLPEAYRAIMATLGSPVASLARIGEVIREDPAMSAKILHLVNSAFFGLGRRMSSTKEAASFLGFDTLKALILSVGIFSQFKLEQVLDGGFSIDELLEHSLAVANLAQKIAHAEGKDKQFTDDCFLSGVVHDIGILILEENFSADYARVRQLMDERDLPLIEAEMEVFGTTHGAIGAYILGLWRLPPQVVEAVAFHELPGRSDNEEFSPLAALHSAEILIQQSGAPGAISTLRNIELDEAYLRRIGTWERLDAWRELLPGKEEA